MQANLNSPGKQRVVSGHVDTPFKYRGAATDAEKKARVKVEQVMVRLQKKSPGGTPRKELHPSLSEYLLAATALEKERLLENALRVLKFIPTDPVIAGEAKRSAKYWAQRAELAHKMGLIRDVKHCFEQARIEGAFPMAVVTSAFSRIKASVKSRKTAAPPMKVSLPGKPLEAIDEKEDEGRHRMTPISAKLAERFREIDLEDADNVAQELTFSAPGSLLDSFQEEEFDRSLDKEFKSLHIAKNVDTTPRRVKVQAKTTPLPQRVKKVTGSVGKPKPPSFMKPIQKEQEEFGSSVQHGLIRASPAMKAKLGSDKIMSPVRRSKRTPSKYTPMKTLLEESNYAYSPNPALGQKSEPRSENQPMNKEKPKKGPSISSTPKMKNDVKKSVDPEPNLGTAEVVVNDTRVRRSQRLRK